jgi:hypothetical protein
LNYQAIRRAREWSKEAIVERLHELHKAGVKLRAGVIQENDIPLSGAVQRYFGTLRNALRAAKLPLPPDRSHALGHWTEESVLKALQDLNSEGEDLRHRLMKQKRQALFFAAKKLFGSYTNAVAEAGIDYWQMSQCHLRTERKARKATATVESQPEERG